MSIRKLIAVAGAALVAGCTVAPQPQSPVMVRRMVEKSSPRKCYPSLNVLPGEGQPELWSCSPERYAAMGASHLVVPLAYRK